MLLYKIVGPVQLLYLVEYLKKCKKNMYKKSNSFLFFPTHFWNMSKCAKTCKKYRWNMKI